MSNSDGELVRFVDDDPYGLWRADELAVYLGRESDHPDAPPIDLFALRGETIALHSAFARGIVERVA